MNDKPRFRGKFRTQTVRMQDWDYRSPATFFVTICTKGRYPWFGEIMDGEMVLSGVGMIVDDEWQKTERIRSYITLDEYIIMPNHIHGIITIGEREYDRCVEPSSFVEPNNWGFVETCRRHVSTDIHNVHDCTNIHFICKPPTSGSLSAIINQFKESCTKRIRKEYEPDFHWQPRFYEDKIRCFSELRNMRAYIKNNPKHWDEREWEW